MKLQYTQRIVLGFAAVIVCGAILLCLPISSRAGIWTPLPDALFTATSATCVTGLVLYDTYSYWSLFGQIVILILIQVGGIGFMTAFTMFSIFLRRKIGLSERQLLAHSTGMLNLGGVVHIIKRIVILTFTVEAIGAIVLATRFCPVMGFWDGLYNAVFHSISAFCNAGFDLMGKFGEFSSLTTFVGDGFVSVMVILLIIAGGIGFVVWDDAWTHKLRFKKFSLHSKIVLVVTLILILLGWLLFFVFEADGLLAELSGGEKATAALFQSVTPRTAGFNTIDTAGLSEAGILLTIVFMIIGGSSSSTAGGIKTSTLAVLFLNAVSSARKTHSIVAFRRRLSESMVKNACALVIIYLSAIVLATLILCAVESLPFKEALFEATSALGTVGLSLGVTTSLGIVGKVVITILMFAGRVGWLTLLIAIAKKQLDAPVERPTENILIG